MTLLAWIFLILAIHFLIAFIFVNMLVGISDRYIRALFSMSWEITIAVFIGNRLYWMYLARMYRLGHNKWHRLCPDERKWEQCPGELQKVHCGDLMDPTEPGEESPDYMYNYVCETCGRSHNYQIGEYYQEHGHDRETDGWKKFKQTFWYRYYR